MFVKKHDFQKLVDRVDLLERKLEHLKIDFTAQEMTDRFSSYRTIPLFPKVYKELEAVKNYLRIEIKDVPSTPDYKIAVKKRSK